MVRTDRSAQYPQKVLGPAEKIILTALLNTYATGAGNSGGLSTIRDQSLELDHSEIHIIGV